MKMYWVKHWSEKIGEELYKLSRTMTGKAKLTRAFSDLGRNLYTKNGMELREDVAKNLRIVMDTKCNAVKRIAEYADFLSYNRNNDSLNRNSNFFYFNADNFSSTVMDNNTNRDHQKYMRKMECKWWCHQKEYDSLPGNTMMDRQMIDSLFEARNKHDVGDECSCDYLQARKPSEFFQHFPLEYNSHFEDYVNLNFSVVKVAAEIYNRESSILEGARWSEALDLIFKENYENDSTLTWQYLASPDGYMRHYPGVKWSDERYNQTYDMRMRSWYTEAMTSPKDVMILVDKSGSTTGNKRRLIAHIVNNILDTLNDNDFVNIYTFANSTDPLVNCFKDTLVQANEENLRLLREYLPVFELHYHADISVGLAKAFEILKKYRGHNKYDAHRLTGSQCNQIIFLITEWIDYDYHPEMIKIWNKNKDVRIFTYQVEPEFKGSDIMETIACTNMGYFVNISDFQEVRDKMLNYLNVLSRPVNAAIRDKQTCIWSYLYVDLADRRISNWLWRKFEGIRQREVFLDHTKREYIKLNQIMTSANHALLKDDHEYQKYETKHKYHYMTTVSYPVYGRRKSEVDLIGVAGVDVPIKLLNSKIPHHELGVNGYALIVTNNGYVLLHPDHRRTFEQDVILKPTFNRVDLLEVEIMDDESEPRLFNKSIVELREKIVLEERGVKNFRVKYGLYDLKRVMLSERYYYYTNVGPFGFAIVLPGRYGLTKIKISGFDENGKNSLLNSVNWKVHPEWIYCSNCGDGTPEEKIRFCLKRKGKCKMEPLMNVLLKDASITNEFEQNRPSESDVRKYYVSKIFLATHSGLTRWKTFKINEDEDESNDFEVVHPKAIDEDWYKRAVEEYYNDKDMFIYSVPFEISGYENNTLITGTNAIFVSNNNKETPVATIGLQFNHNSIIRLYNDITEECPGGKKPCNITCSSAKLMCYILDNNAYVVLSDNIEYTGRFIGDIRPDIMHYLVKFGVFKETRMFDYQAICPKLPPKKKKGKKSAATRSNFNYRNLLRNTLDVFFWFASNLMLLIQSAFAGEDYQSIKPDTIAYEHLEIKKTYPTPCDQEMYLFNLGSKFVESPTISNGTSKFDCVWPYIVRKIPHSNLLFLAVNEACNTDTLIAYPKSPTPREIDYKETLPCYIATRNNYTRLIYMKCHKKYQEEEELYQNRTYCGHTW